jgi:NAD(P)-dependent dehydrogenase (short-subunit alcohol dehydrogenase family)
VVAGVRHAGRRSQVAVTLSHEESAILGRRLARATGGVDHIRTSDAGVPLGQVCRPEDRRTLVRFLASPAREYVNGQLISVDHGQGSPGVWTDRSV